MDLFVLISIIWFGSEIILARLKRSADQKDTDKSSLKILWITISISITAGILIKYFVNAKISPETIVPYYVGIAFIIIGLIIRWWAILTLKESFTVNVAVHDRHQLTQSGIYKHVRHPSYTGSLLSFLGLGIAFNSWLSIFIIFCPILLAFINRMKVEEKVLHDTFGVDYTQYCNKTRRLLPGVY